MEHIPTFGELISGIFVWGIVFSIIALNVYHFARYILSKDRHDDDNA